MEQEKSLFFYVRFLMKESRSQLLNSLFGLRGILLLGGVVYELIMSYNFSNLDNMDSYSFFGLTIIWLLIVFPFRIGKMFFLLPMSQRERKKYAVAIWIKYILYSFLYFFVLYLPFYLFHKVSPLMYGLLFITKVFPVILPMSASVTFSTVSKKVSGFFSTRNYFSLPAGVLLAEDIEREMLQRKKDELQEKDKKKKKKHDIRVFLQIVAFLLEVFGLTINLFLFSFMSTAYILISLILYVISVLLTISLFVDLFKEINGEEEEHGKEESKCSF